MTKVELLNRWYKDIWEDGKINLIEDYFIANPPDQYVAPYFGIEASEVREWVVIFRSFVTDIKVKIVHSIEDEHWLSGMLEVTCRNRTDGAPIKVYQQIMVRYDGDLMAESYPAFDFIRFFEQLGQLPDHTHALLLGGTRLN